MSQPVTEVTHTLPKLGLPAGKIAQRKGMNQQLLMLIASRKSK